MNGTRRPGQPPSEPPSAAGVRMKPNRLRRSFRRSQSEPRAEAQQAQQPEFKTPTRIPKSRLGGGFCGPSPHNDSDIQQDIIWDATSPSPNRLSKKGKKLPVGVVTISEIVSRIAPKYGRPEVTEPTLQQWIGDSAAIPCTPDVLLPRTKRRTPRPNAADDLLKLAKQFDFNMFQNDGSDAEDQQSSEIWSEDVLDVDIGGETEGPAGVCPPADLPVEDVLDVDIGGETECPAGVCPPADLPVEDDLDFLFDGPTQNISQNLSQASSVHPTQLKPEASGRLPVPSHSHFPMVSTTWPKGTSANTFEDDWDNDDLLNDSLVFEMTQNPHKFLTPNHCSTQKTSSETGRHTGSDRDSGVGHREPAVSGAGKDNGPNVTCQSKALESKTPRSRWTQKTSIVGSGRNLGTSTQTLPKRRSVSGSKTEAAGRRETLTVSVNIQSSVFLDEDLDAFFSSEPAWDDLDDDDLLCEVSQDLENQIQSVDNSSTTVAPTFHQRLVLQPSNWNDQTRPANQTPPSTQIFPKTQTSGSVNTGSWRPAAGSTSNITNPPTNQAKDPPGCTGTKVRTRSTDSLTHWTNRNIGSSSPTSPGRNGKRPSRFTFKKPLATDSTIASKASAKCSAAEIELKKQQAVERRRRRLQDTQNLRGPT